MEYLKKVILKNASVSENGIVNFDSFLNHQIDTEVLDYIGKAFAETVDTELIDRIITIEPSGIAPALMASVYMGNLPVVFAKRSRSVNTPDAVHTAVIDASEEVGKHRVIIEKKFIPRYERILIIDDIIARGNSIKALIEIIEAAGAEVKGVLCAVEKTAEGGAQAIRDAGYCVDSIVKIKDADFKTQKITFE